MLSDIEDHVCVIIHSAHIISCIALINTKLILEQALYISEGGASMLIAFVRYCSRWWWDAVWLGGPWCLHLPLYLGNSSCMPEDSGSWLHYWARRCPDWSQASLTIWRWISFLSHVFLHLVYTQVSWSSHLHIMRIWNRQTMFRGTGDGIWMPKAHGLAV